MSDKSQNRAKPSDQPDEKAAEKTALNSEVAANAQTDAKGKQEIEETNEDASSGSLGFDKGITAIRFQITEDGETIASKDVKSKTPEKTKEDSEGLSAELEAIKNTGSPEQSGLAKNIQEMRGAAKKTGISTEAIDQYAWEKLAKAKPVSETNSEQFSRGKFKALEPETTLLAEQNTQESQDKGNENDASEVISESIKTGWIKSKIQYTTIFREVKAVANYKIKPEDSYESIAKMQLVTDASKEEVDTYIKAIHDLNELPGKPLPYMYPIRENVLLPGFNKNGDLTIENRNSDEITFTQKGEVIFEDKNGTKTIQKRTMNGGMIEEHTGLTPEENFSIFVTLDGRAFEKSKNKNWAEVAHSDSDIRVQSFLLIDKALEKMNPMEVRDLRTDIEKFDRRFGLFVSTWLTEAERQSPEIVQENRLAASGEAARTLRTAYEILAAPSDSIQTPDQVDNKYWRGKLVSQAIHHAADPSTIDQSNHPFCPVNALESRMYSRHPSKVLKVLSEVIQNGIFDLKKHEYNIVDLKKQPGESLAPDSDSQSYDINKSPGSACRSFASQLFVSAAVNSALQNRNSVYRYATFVTGDGQNYYIPKSAENNREKWVHENTAAKSDIAVSDVELLEVYKQFTGHDEKYYYFRPAQGNSHDNYKDDGVVSLWTPEHLKPSLLRLKALNLLPALADVDSAAKFIRKEWKRTGMSGTPTGDHALAISSNQ